MAKRKRPTHFDGEMRLAQMPVQFVTVCTKDRRAILANGLAHEAILKAWHRAEGWLIGRYVVMPDHVHLFCAPATWSPPPLAKWIAFWKRTSARSFPQEVPRPIWQDDYWDRLLRSNESYAQKWQYTFENPVRSGLVADSREWPYAGELNVLRIK